MTRARNSANLASQGNLFVDIANDRTGIGSVVPAQNLHVAGTAGFHADTTFVGDLYNTVWDRSDNSLKFADQAKALFGTDSDLTIRHTGSAGYIENTTGFLFIHGNDIALRSVAQENYIVCDANAEVEIYYDGSKKLETTAYGTNTTGTAVNDGLVVAGVATVTTMNVTGVLTYDDVTSVDSVGFITARSGIKDSTLTSGRVVTAGTDGRLQDSAVLTFDGSALSINSTGDQMLNLNSTDNGGTYIGYNRSGTRTAYLGHGGTGGTFSLRNEISNGNVTIAGNDGGSYINMLVFDTGNGGNATFSGDLTVSGNLSVTGTTTQNNSVSTAQKTITLASGAANNAAVDGAGIVVDAGSDTDKTLKWLDSTDRWTFTGGDVAANAFYGDGSNLTGIVSDKIFEGNTEVETVDTGSDGHIKFTTEGTLALQIDSNGRILKGTSSSVYDVDIVGTERTVEIGVENNSSAYRVALNTTNNVNADFNIQHKANLTSIGTGVNVPLCFHINGGTNAVSAEKMRLDQAGTLHIKGGNIEAGDDSFPLNFTDSLSNYIGVAADGGSNGGDALFIAHSHGSGLGIFGYEAGGDRLVIATDSGGGGNKIDFILDAGVTSNGSADNLNGKVPKMRIDNSGRVMIGTTTEGETTADDLTIATSGNTGITIRSGTTGEGNIFFSDGTSGVAEYRGIVRYEHGNDAFVIKTLGSDRLRINSSGNALFGGTGVSQTNRQLVVGSDSEANLAIETHNTSASETANIRFYRSRGTAASPTTLVDGDMVSQLLFYGHDGTDYTNTAARIRVHCSSTVANNSVPSSLTFATFRASTTLCTEALRLTHMQDITSGNGSGYSIWKGTANDQFCRYQFRQTTGDNRGFALLEERGDSNCIDLFISKSRGGNGTGVINSGDSLGTIKFTGADGTRQHNAAGMIAWTSGTIATGRVPANLSFYTAPDSVSGYLERLRIKSAGGIKFPTIPSSGNLIEAGGSTVYSNAAINLWRQGNGYCDMRLTSNYGVKIALAGASNNTDEAVIQQDNSKNMYIKNEASQPMYFQTGSSNTTRLAINHSGARGIQVYGDSAYNDSNSGARGISVHYSGSASVPIYFGSETGAAQKGMYMYGYWMYIRGHQNEGVRFIFSQASGAPRSDQYQFKYNSAYRPGSSQTWDGFSDQRAKENVQTLTNCIEKIKKLRPVTYDWTDDFADSQTMYIMGRDENGGTVAKKENGYDTDRKNGQYGFIAQEYETVLPKDVKQDKYELGGVEIEDFKTINHDCLIPTLTAALKEAVAKIEVLEAKVAALEGS